MTNPRISALALGGTDGNDILAIRELGDIDAITNAWTGEEISLATLVVLPECSRRVFDVLKDLFGSNGTIHDLRRPGFGDPMLAKRHLDVGRMELALTRIYAHLGIAHGGGIPIETSAEKAITLIAGLMNKPPVTIQEEIQRNELNHAEIVRAEAELLAAKEELSSEHGKWLKEREELKEFVDAVRERVGMRSYHPLDSVLSVISQVAPAPSAPSELELELVAVLMSVKLTLNDPTSGYKLIASDVARLKAAHDHAIGFVEGAKLGMKGR